MKTLLTSLLAALMLFTAVPALAKTHHKHHGKGVKIGKHFSPKRKARLNKWAHNEAKRKKKSGYHQYFSGKRMPHHRKHS